MIGNIKHFMDVKLLSFSHNPKSVLTLYPLYIKISFMYVEKHIRKDIIEKTNRVPKFLARDYAV